MIKTDERRIRKLVAENIKAKLAFNKMCEFFKIMDKLQATNHSSMIKQIYLENEQNFDRVSLALSAKIGEKTCYRYREKYADCFYLCFNMLLNEH